jgi:glycosyltransferase involved in cell wall biosynthesis
MHILFLTDNFPPEVNAPASRTFEHCREWVKAGEKVTVITCAPNFPKGKVFVGYKNKLWQVEEMEGIRVIRVWTYITANAGFVRRTLDYISFMVAAIIASFFIRRVDVIIGTSPQFFTVCAANVVSFFKRKPWVFELRDIWPESIKAVGAMKESKVTKLLEKLELYLYRKADKIISVTHAFKTNLIARGIDGNKIEVVTNGVDLTSYSRRSKDTELIYKHNLHDKFVAGYIGTHGLAHGLQTLLNAADLLRKHDHGKDIIILLLGDGAVKEALQQEAAERQLTNVLFVDSVPKQEVVRYWSLLDTSIIHLKKTPLFQSVIPSKMFECMAMGIPVLHGVAGESADIVRKENVGLVFESDNALALSNLLLELKQDIAILEELSANALKAAPNYDRKTLALNMLDELRQVK